jgi:hypothetical protein
MTSPPERFLSELTEFRAARLIDITNWKIKTTLTLLVRLYTKWARTFFVRAHWLLFGFVGGALVAE